MAKPKEKERARLLRKEGWSYKQIAHELKVSSSTVGVWCSDVILLPEQIKELERRARDPFYGKRWEYCQKRREERIKKTETLKQQAIKTVGDLSEREFYLLGIGLYWAEGFKKDKMVGFANTDPQMIKFFLEWLLKCAHVPKNLIKLRVGINEIQKNRVEEIHDYWSIKTGFSKESFYKPYFQRTRWQKSYEHPENYFGTMRIRVLKSTDLLRKIGGMIEGVEKHAFAD